MGSAASLEVGVRGGRGGGGSGVVDWPIAFFMNSR